MLTRSATNDRDDRAPEDSRLSSSSSLIMIHRHTARLIVYRSFTMPASQPANTCGDVASIIHMHLCTFFFGPAVFRFVYNSPARLPSFRCSLALHLSFEYFVNYGSWFTRPVHSIPNILRKPIFT